MADIIDITDKLAMKKAADLLAKPGAKLFCHPNDALLFDGLPADKTQTSNMMEPGKPYVLDIDTLTRFLRPAPMFIDLMQYLNN